MGIVTFASTRSWAVFGVLAAITVAVPVWAENPENQLIPKGIYGKDNRLDAYAASANARLLAQYSVVFFTDQRLAEEDDAYVLKDTVNLQQGLAVCPNERYAKQPAAGFCSGFLIDRDKVVTAGHCLNPIILDRLGVDIDGVRLVFGFAMRDAETANTRFNKQDVYRVAKILEYAYGTADATRKPEDDPSKKDWAVIQLDRQVADFFPVAIREGDSPINEALTMIGYPLGLPVKITDGGRILGDSGGNVLKTNLDAFVGNSGSAVFNTASIKRGEPMLEGILVGGRNDFVNDDASPCYQIKHFANREAYEIVTKINRVLRYQEPPPSPSTDKPEICIAIPELCRSAK